MIEKSSSRSFSRSSWQPLGAAARSAVVSALDAFETPPKRPLLDNKAPCGTSGLKSQSWRYKALSMVGRLLTGTGVKRVVKGKVPKDSPSVCYCCRYPAKKAGGASVECAEVYRTPRGRLKLVGLQKCGSSWLCPVCTVSHARRQWMKTEKALRRCRAIGGIAVMVTNTVGRDPSESLEVVKAALMNALGAARHTRSWKRAKKSKLLLGAMPFIEVLHGKVSGWHPHSHTLMFFKGSQAEIEAVIKEFHVAYIDYLKRKERAVDAEAQHTLFLKTDEDVARYVSKSNAAWEVSGGVKAARSRSSRSFWDLLFLADSGDEDAEKLAREYAAVMPGVQSGVMSAQLCKNLRMIQRRVRYRPSQLRAKVSAYKALKAVLVSGKEPENDLLGQVHSDVLCRVVNNGYLAALSDAVEAFEGWSSLEDSLYKWARCTEYERFCYVTLLEEVV